MNIIKEKINKFNQLQCKVQVTTVPNQRYPTGKFYKGYITMIYENKITFLDDKEGATQILFIEIVDIDKCRGEDDLSR